MQAACLRLRRRFLPERPPANAWAGKIAPGNAGSASKVEKRTLELWQIEQRRGKIDARTEARATKIESGDLWFPLNIGHLSPFFERRPDLLNEF